MFTVLRQRHPLRFHLCWILLVKIAALSLLYVLLFDPARRPVIGADAAMARLLGKTQAEEKRDITFA